MRRLVLVKFYKYVPKDSCALLIKQVDYDGALAKSHVCAHRKE